jgi:hypothetical protein
MGQVFNLGCFVKSEDRSIMGPNECAREEKGLVTKRSEGEGLPIGGQPHGVWVLTKCGLGIRTRPSPSRR